MYRTITQTVNGVIFPNLGLGKILSLALSAGYSYSWATSQATGTSASVTCPKGGFTCGIMVTSYVVKSVGETWEYYENEQNDIGCHPATKSEPYAVPAGQYPGGDPFNVPSGFNSGPA